MADQREQRQQEQDRQEQDRQEPRPQPHQPDQRRVRPVDMGPAASGSGEGESTRTVLIAFGANLIIALAKSAAAFLSHSASMMAEAAHSWADTGNEVLLIVADRRSRKAPDRDHPLGYGREAYVWSLFAAMGLFIAGSVVSLFRGVQELLHPEPGGDFLISYIVLAVAFIFEGISFTRSTKQARPEAKSLQRDLIDHVLETSDPTLRAVFFEDAAALIGLVLAGGGLALHQVTGNPVFDALGSLLIGLLLAGTAYILLDRNREFIVGEEAAPAVRAATIRSLLEMPEIDRVTYLRLEVVGPRHIYVVGDVDVTGDEAEPEVARTLRYLEARLRESPAVVDAVLSLSVKDEPSITE
ncbi:MAG TPA: cation transporter [Segeticoccus sp.]|uniref:cation diffusion facilitator family transporter n=1 Tax=Segeticoccus sp. TaxID=2706531 RepID=UPI002D805A66|nr:cation transporter [Segeticoccus sp.]HET8600354.1 cation transporter [Segeticoccus sp.]